MQTLREWQEQINRLSEDLRAFAKKKNPLSFGNDRPALAARMRRIVTALRASGSIPSPHGTQEETLVAVIATVESRANDLTGDATRDHGWWLAETIADFLDTQLLAVVEEIYHLDASSSAIARRTELPIGMSKSTVPGTLPAPRDTGIWRLIQPLKAGHQGEVFLATGKPEDGLGVLKRLPTSRFSDNKARVRFLREIAILKRLNHPCILRVLGARTTGEDPWLVTQFAPFGSMADHVATLRGDAWRCLRLARDLAAALGAAHSIGIVHRDVKPKNILFFSLDRIAIGDFGIAHDDDATSVTSDHERVGARCFSPPEWEHGHIQPTPTFDVYSLGKVIYYMLVGQCPPREKFQDAGWNLVEVLDRPEMRFINLLLEKMIVEKSDKRLPLMTDVIRELDRAISNLFGIAPQRNNSCRLCGNGIYRDAGAWRIDRRMEFMLEQESRYEVSLASFNPRFIVCNICGDARIIFGNLGGLTSRPEWQGPGS
jgi:serine/threonine protein kinase